jgi:glutamate synthase (NADPH) large chain
VSSDIVSSDHHSVYPKIVGLPPKQGLYDPSFERDACGVGFVVNIKGKKSHEIVQQGLTILLNLDHRGARGSEFNTGDGAGILMQLPHKFFQKVCAQEGITLPAPGEYGVGMVFCPPDEADCGACQARFAEIVREEGQTLLGWRRVVTDNSSLGETAKLGEPIVHQVFIAKNAETLADDPLAFERKLYVIRKRAEHAIRYNANIPGDRFYMPSLSARTIVYKGMLLPEQVPAYFRELDDPDVESALALVHSRFSTNTFPSWERAHPYRYIIHNGEINTLRGNVNWMYARQSTFESALFGDDLGKILPVINNDGSDSAMFDEALEFLTLAGRPLHQVMMMMIPEPWSGHKTMDDAKKAFYEYHSTLMEPWDGPASIGFTDGTVIGATLDRNGLRPSRYYVTKDDLVIMASEVGVLDIPADRIQYK